jgi:threonine/homoserine/homoserine lactone efflux protein
VTGGWGSELTALVPLALVIALSPLSLIPAVLVLQAPRARASSLAFLGGWLAALAALTALFVGISGLLGGLHKAPPWAPWVRVAIGAALIAFGVFQWLTRHSGADMPAWMRSFTTVTPVRAGVTAAVLAVVRPEVLFICAAAGLVIAGGGPGVTDIWISVAFFVAVAASSVAIPVLAYVGAGDRLDDPLARLKDWMERHHAALVAVMLILIGLMVLYKGIHGL